MFVDVLPKLFKENGDNPNVLVFVFVFVVPNPVGVVVVVPNPVGAVVVAPNPVVVVPNPDDNVVAPNPDGVVVVPNPVDAPNIDGFVDDAPNVDVVGFVPKPPVEKPKVVFGGFVAFADYPNGEEKLKFVGIS